MADLLIIHTCGVIRLQQTTPVAVNLGAGTYYVTVTDMNGCVAVDSVKINQPDEINLTEVHIDSRCNGSKPGSIELTVNGGTPPYLYLWSALNGFIADTKDIDNLIGNLLYTVIVTDALGCKDTLEVFVDEEKNMELSAVITDIPCYGYATGAIDVTVSHGKAPFTYLWNTGQTTQDLSGIRAGFYPDLQLKIRMAAVKPLNSILLNLHC